MAAGGGLREPMLSGSSKRSCWSSIASFLPILHWLPHYDVKANLMADVSGGITLGCILMGQSLAHAGLCGVNLINGPYSCILPPIVYSVFGTCVHASVGTGGLVSLLTGEQLMKYGADVDYRTHVGGVLTLLVGVFMFLMGVCRLSFLVRFLSRPALSGFITASALLIIFSQVAPMLGMPPWAAKGGILHILAHHASNLEFLNPYTTVFSIVALSFLMNAKRLKQVPLLKPIADFKELVLLASGALFAKWFNAHHPASNQLQVVGAMPSGLPSFQLPYTAADAHLIKDLWPSALLVAFVVFLSSFAGAKKFAMQDGYQVAPFNELIALGAANMVGAFNGAVPTQIGLSRMGIARGAGVKTQLGANVFVGIIVSGITFAFSPYLFNVPKCVLNCIIINGASHLTEFGEARRLWCFGRCQDYSWKLRGDIVVWLTGFCCTLYLGALQGIISAVVISLGLILYQVVNPEITQLGYKPSPDPSDTRPRKWISRSNPAALDEPDILVLRLEGPLFYANVESVQEWLEQRELDHFEHTGEMYKGVILTAAAVPFIDSTAMSTLVEMTKSYRERGVLFFIANTFGHVGRLITDNLETMERTEVRRALRAEVQQCSSIDDFVRLIRRSTTTGSRRCLLPAGKSFLAESQP